MKVKIYSAYDLPKPSELTGFSPIEKTYMEQYNKDGIKEIIEVGETNWYAEVQSYADETDVNKIMARVAGGETGLLDQMKGFYLDTQGLPASLMEAQNIILKGQKAFDNLPAEIRRMYDNDAMKFMANFDYDQVAKNLEEVQAGKAVTQAVKEGGNDNAENA
ncbi:minor capsid protein [Capybara microvirus Cap3_SP_443]|nr:minor capsid protein [Capybara microvirus Cap3_SP_443]